MTSLVKCDCDVIGKMFTWPAVQRVMRQRLQELVHSDAERTCLDINNFEDYEDALNNEIEKTEVHHGALCPKHTSMQIRAMNECMDGLGYNQFY